jgi:hypothetical protein
MHDASLRAEIKDGTTSVPRIPLACYMRGEIIVASLEDHKFTTNLSHVAEN